MFLLEQAVVLLLLGFGAFFIGGMAHSQHNRVLGFMAGALALAALGQAGLIAWVYRGLR